MSISENPNIFKPSYYKGDGLKKTDLLLRLNELHKKLATVSQDDRPRGLKEISSHLVTKGFLNHADKDLRLIVLCCLADVFRIYAPEAPFCDPDMLLVFEGFVMQLRSLSTNKPESATGTKICYILNSLSTVKSCVVPVILSQAGLQGAPEVVTGLFDALLSCVSADYSENGMIIYYFY